jgi:predicted RNA binding protein YcfA (HicA-like mRNA interferase family)
MPRHVPSLKARELISLLERVGCTFYREGRGDHLLYVRYVQGKKRVVPIDMGAGEFSPPYVLRIFRQFGLTDEEIEGLLEH